MADLIDGAIAAMRPDAHKQIEVSLSNLSTQGLIDKMQKLVNEGRLAATRLEQHPHDIALRHTIMAILVELELATRESNRR